MAARARTSSRPSAAKTPSRRQPCCDWVGEGGAGHFVKMVHNGIEYGDMQLICEAYQLMKREASGLTNDEMHEVFAEWNKRRAGQLPDRNHARHPRRQGRRTAVARGRPDPRHGRARRAPASGPCWHSLDVGMPLTLITEAVFARCLSRPEGRPRGRRKILTGPEEADDRGDQEGVRRGHPQGAATLPRSSATRRATC